MNNVKEVPAKCKLLHDLPIKEYFNSLNIEDCKRCLLPITNYFINSKNFTCKYYDITYNMVVDYVNDLILLNHYSKYLIGVVSNKIDTFMLSDNQNYFHRYCEIFEESIFTLLDIVNQDSAYTSYFVWLCDIYEDITSTKLVVEFNDSESRSDISRKLLKLFFLTEFMCIELINLMIMDKVVYEYLLNPENTVKPYIQDLFTGYDIYNHFYKTGIKTSCRGCFIQKKVNNHIRLIAQDFVKDETFISDDFKEMMSNWL